MDPYNPVDAIFAAARYLKAAGADKDIRAAVFAYNHADWYVDSRAAARAGHRRPAGQPRRLAHRPHRGPLPGRRQGHLRGRDHQEGPARRSARNRSSRSRLGEPPRHLDLRRRRLAGRRGQRRAGGQDRRVRAARATSSRSRTRTATRTRTGAWPRSPSSTPRRSRRRSTRPRSSGCWRCPSRTPSRRTPRPRHRPSRRARDDARRPPSAVDRRPSRSTSRAAEPPVKERLFAHPTRANAAVAGGAQQEFLRTGRIDGALTPARALGLARDQIVIKQLKAGSQVPAGTVLGRIGKASSAQAPARALRDPPGRPRRPAHRPEADPRRLEAARVDRDLPRQGQEPVRRPRRRDAHRSARSC